MTNRVLGTNLSAADQKLALSCFVHRYTKDHKPQWANALLGNGQPYPVQFASDQEWLANTTFQVTKNGSLSRATNATCDSRPTWPDGNPYIGR